MTVWAKEEIFSFIEALKSEPVIWDPNEEAHKDKKKVNDAWMRIQNIFNLPIEELKKKKESLLATYRGYYRKKEASIKSGAGVDDVYHPIWFAYDYMDSFLGSVYKCKQTINTDQDIVTAPFETDEEKEASGSTEPITTASVETSNPIVQNRTTRRRLNPPELQIASKQMSEAFNNLNKVINRTAKDDFEDECDVFGKLIAKKLKKMPEDEREDLMLEIHSLFRQPSRIRSSSSNESFRSSTPNTHQFPIYSEPFNTFTQNPSAFVHKLKRPKSANNPNTTMASPRPHSSFSEPSNRFTPFSEQFNESQYILHIPELNENSSLIQNSSKVNILRNEVIRPAKNLCITIPNTTQAD